MSAADLLQGMCEATVAITLASLLVLAIRKPFRRAFGAGVSYRAWLIVPVVLIAAILPAMRVQPMLHITRIPISGLAGASPATTMHLAEAQWILGIWLCGALMMAAYLVVLQRRFLYSLGNLQLRSDGFLQAEISAGLPAVHGIWQPRIIVPADFDAHYSAEERRLMAEHERSHLSAGDLPANALVAGLRSIFWFNPLLHYAAYCFRHDQELACDQRVIARHPQSRRAYGQAMFKTQLAAGALPLGCHWGYGHPLKERIAMLKNPIPTRSRVVTGGVMMLALTLGAGFTAWSAQPVQNGPALQAAPEPGGKQVVAEGMPASPLYVQAAIQQGPVGKRVVPVDGVTGEGIKNAGETSRPTKYSDAAAIGAAWKWKFKPSYESAETQPDEC